MSSHTQLTENSEIGLVIAVYDRDSVELERCGRKLALKVNSMPFYVQAVMCGRKPPIAVQFREVPKTSNTCTVALRGDSSRLFMAFNKAFDSDFAGLMYFFYEILRSWGNLDGFFHRMYRNITIKARIDVPNPRQMQNAKAMNDELGMFQVLDGEYEYKTSWFKRAPFY
ncbi:hypothetical protein FF38_14099 [Lucilia cuprina]|uniref:Uncharacterized protein n=1 Tax=Lucilia cuprina TaxID=7375 RepID=A0A0L0BWW6_LUCCU|nr:hypothetical protein FF38_14099 [Lucilia cuprina]